MRGGNKMKFSLQSFLMETCLLKTDIIISKSGAENVLKKHVNHTEKTTYLTRR